MLQTGLRHADHRFGGLKVGRRSVQRGIGAFQIFGGDCLLRKMTTTTGVTGRFRLLRLGFGHFRLRFRELRFGVESGNTIRGVIDPEQNVAGFD